jgi:SAGA-associated factor 29
MPNQLLEWLLVLSYEGIEIHMSVLKGKTVLMCPDANGSCFYPQHPHAPTTPICVGKDAVNSQHQCMPTTNNTSDSPLPYRDIPLEEKLQLSTKSSLHRRKRHPAHCEANSRTFTSTSPNMSARSRPRANHNQDADEERRLWKEIKDKAHEVDSMIARSNEIGNEILQTETQQAALLDANKPVEAALDRKLEELYRENLKLCEEVQHLIAGASSDMNVLDSINILAGLREASSAEQASAAAAPLGQRDRTASSKLGRDRPKKSGSRGSNSAAVTEDGGDDSTAPSPRITLGQANRLSAKDKSSRAGSIPATRETSVKIEDGVESVASMDSAPSFSKGDSLPPGARLNNRVTFKAGETVFYRHKDKLLEGEGILCRVTAVIGEGKQRRYEIQDVDTDTTAASTAAGGGKAPAVANPSATSSFRASISSLMQIPESNERVPDLPKGKQVFALYPETTTFYRGEVSASWRAKHDAGQPVRVKFEGEMDNIESQVVERRYVLLER